MNLAFIFIFGVVALIFLYLCSSKDKFKKNENEIIKIFLKNQKNVDLKLKYGGIMPNEQGNILLNDLVLNTIEEYCNLKEIDSREIKQRVMKQTPLIFKDYNDMLAFIKNELLDVMLY